MSDGYDPAVDMERCFEEWWALEREALRRRREETCGQGNETMDDWDKWYATLPADLKRRLSIYDFRRLGECFRQAFRIDRIAQPFNWSHLRKPE